MFKQRVKKALAGLQLPKIMAQTYAQEYFFTYSVKLQTNMLPLNKGLERTKKIEQKPQVTKGIQTSMTQRDRYKETIQEKDRQRKTQKHGVNRKY